MAATATTEERFCDVGRGVTLCYDQTGDPNDAPLLLCMGLGMQLIAWPAEFVAALAARGFFVTRFDNRDSGRSTWLDGPRPPGLRQLATRRFAPDQYDLADMADDAAGLLSALGLAPAHVVGASLGGMVAQTIAARHPQSVRTLTSIMSMTGSRFHGQPAPGVYRYLLSSPPRDRDGAVAAAVRIFRRVGSPRYPLDGDVLRATVEQAFDRGSNPAGTARQLAAILKSGDRTKQLRGIRAPTLVIHGEADPLVRPSGGRATAAAIPGAELITFAGMGHDLPPELWPAMIDAIAGLAQRYDSSAAAAR